MPSPSFADLSRSWDVATGVCRELSIDLEVLGKLEIELAHAQTCNIASL